MQEKAVDSCHVRPRFRSQVCHLLLVWPWGIYSASPFSGPRSLS